MFETQCLLANSKHYSKLGKAARNLKPLSRAPEILPHNRDKACCELVSFHFRTGGLASPWIQIIHIDISSLFLL
jgi:hypothetical protein